MTQRPAGKLLVCGGRDFRDKAFVYRVLDELVASWGEPTYVIHGAAQGADSLADAWAKERKYAVVAVPAEWATYGRSAGVRRNLKMLVLHQPHLVVVFPGGKGTAHMLRLCQDREVPFIQVHKESV